MHVTFVSAEIKSVAYGAMGLVFCADYLFGVHGSCNFWRSSMDLCVSLHTGSGGWRKRTEEHGGAQPPPLPQGYGANPTCLSACPCHTPACSPKCFP